MSNDLTKEEQYHLESFVSSYFDIPQEEVNGRILDNFEADEHFELEFVEKTEKGGAHQDFIDIPIELVSLVDYLDELVEFNIKNTKKSQKGYISQDEDADSLYLLIETVLEDMETEINELPRQMQNQVRAILAMIRFALHTEDTEAIENIYTPLRYIVKRARIPMGRYKHGYQKIGEQMDNMFEKEDDVVDTLGKYFAGSDTELRRALKKIREKQDEQSV